jgi:hypothetical protein
MKRTSLCTTIIFCVAMHGLDILYLHISHMVKLAVQEEYDTYDDEVHFLVKLPFLCTRTKIIEIVAAKDVIFALAQSGLCAAFNRSKSHALQKKKNLMIPLPLCS